MKTLDDIRHAHPELGVALYALEPGRGVTLEIHAPDGEFFAFTGRSEADAVGMAFPPEPVKVETKKTESVFD